MVLNMFIANTKYYTLFPAGVNTFFPSLKIQISQFKEKKLPEGSWSLKLCLLRSTNRAHRSASAALDAGISIDHILAVAFGNSVYGAAISAGAACDAGIINYISHSYSLHTFISHISPQLIKKL